MIFEGTPRRRRDEMDMMALKEDFEKFSYKQRRFEKWHKFFVYKNPVWKENFGHLTEYIETGIIDPEFKKTFN